MIGKTHHGSAVHFHDPKAEEHYSRLHAWGFNCLRILTTWEAIEHAGPYEYDEAYLEYLSGNDFVSRPIWIICLY